MAAVDDILRNLPIDQLAQQVGAQPQEVEQAVQQALPALLGGLQVNAQDPAGADSIIHALGDHQDDLVAGGVDLRRIDTNDGEKIASNIFGSNEPQVYSALGGGAGGALVKRLIPILAPIVLSYISKKVLGGAGGGTTAGAAPGGGGVPSGGEGALPGRGTAQAGPAGGGALDSILRDVLGSAVGGGTTQQQAPPQSGGSIIDILGGLLGGGRR